MEELEERSVIGKEPLPQKNEIHDRFRMSPVVKRFAPPPQLAIPISADISNQVAVDISRGDYTGYGRMLKSINKDVEQIPPKEKSRVKHTATKSHSGSIPRKIAKYNEQTRELVFDDNHGITGDSVHRKTTNNNNAYVGYNEQTRELILDDNDRMKKVAKSDSEPIAGKITNNNNAYIRYDEQTRELILDDSDSVIIVDSDSSSGVQPKKRPFPGADGKNNTGKDKNEKEPDEEEAFQLEEQHTDEDKMGDEANPLKSTKKIRRRVSSWKIVEPLTDEEIAQSTKLFKILKSQHDFMNLTLHLIGGPFRDSIRRSKHKTFHIFLNYGDRTRESTVSTFELEGLEEKYTFKATVGVKNLNRGTSAMMLSIQDRHKDSNDEEKYTTFDIVDIQQHVPKRGKITEEIVELPPRIPKPPKAFASEVFEKTRQKSSSFGDILDGDNYDLATAPPDYSFYSETRVAANGVVIPPFAITQKNTQIEFNPEVPNPREDKETENKQQECIQSRTSLPLTEEDVQEIRRVIDQHNTNVQNKSPEQPEMTQTESPPLFTAEEISNTRQAVDELKIEHEEIVKQQLVLQWRPKIILHYSNLATKICKAHMTKLKAIEEKHQANLDAKMKKADEDIIRQGDETAASYKTQLDAMIAEQRPIVSTQLRQELKEKIEKDETDILRKEAKAEIEQKESEGMRSQVRQEIKDKIEKEESEGMRKEVKAEIEQKESEGMRSQVRQEIKDKIEKEESEGMRKEIKDAIEKEQRDALAKKKADRDRLVISLMNKK